MFSHKIVHTWNSLIYFELDGVNNFHFHIFHHKTGYNGFQRPQTLEQQRASHCTALRRHLKEVRRRLLWDVHCRAHDDVATVVREERALAVEVLPVWGHVGDMQQREEALKESPPDVEGPLVVGREEGLALLSPEQVLSRLAALVFVNLQGRNMMLISCRQGGREATKSIWGFFNFLIHTV